MVFCFDVFIQWGLHQNKPFDWANKNMGFIIPLPPFPTEKTMKIEKKGRK